MKKTKQFTKRKAKTSAKKNTGSSRFKDTKVVNKIRKEFGDVIRGLSKR